MGTEAKIIIMVACMIFILTLIITISCISSNNVAIEQCVAKIILEYKEKGILK